MEISNEQEQTSHKFQPQCYRQTYVKGFLDGDKTMDVKPERLDLLLEEVRLFRLKYDHVSNNNGHAFNIFSILRDEADEVNLHSKFLHNLLNPDGSHGRSTEFLDLFLQHVDLPDYFGQESPVMARREFQNIDIFISSAEKALIIENKIYADDQDRQLERYNETAKRYGFTEINIIYLTLHGNAPSKRSLGHLVKADPNPLKLLSYSVGIHDWLEACISKAAVSPVIRETLVQYQALIGELTGKHHSRKYIMQISERLMDETNFRLALDIGEGLTEAKIAIQLEFWKELENALNPRKIEISDRDKFSPELVEKYYKESRDNRYYGIEIPVSDYDKGSRIVLRIEISWNIYYGFFIRKDNDWLNPKDVAKFSQLVDIVAQLHADFKQTNSWIGWKYPSQKLDFRRFNDENTISLSNKNKRKAHSKALADEILDHVERFKEKLLKI